MASSSLIITKGQTINTEYYLSLLVQLKDILKKLAFLGFHCLEHSPYSPNLAQSESHLFPGLKKQLKSRYFSSDAEVIAAVETWLDGQPSEFFLSGLQKL